MKSVSTIALALALGLGGTIAAAPAVAQKKGAEAPKAAPLKPSPKIATMDKAFQDANTKKDWAAAKTAAEASEAQIKNDDDKLIVGQYFLTVGRETQDNATLLKGIDMMLASGKAGANTAALYTAQGKIAYNAKDYAKTLTAMQAAQAAGSTDPDVLPITFEAMNHSGQTLKALQTLNAGIDANLAAGKPVPNEWYERGFGVAYGVKAGAPDADAIRAQAGEINRKWIAAKPTATTWHDVLVYEQGKGGDADFNNDVRRLMFATGAMRNANDYLEYAEAVYQRYPGETKTVLDDGVKRGIFTFASNRNAGEINGIVTPKIAADKASLAGSDKAARTAANGRTALNTADAYLGYGEYDKAIDLYGVALQKGGVDNNVVNTRLGIAKARKGDKEGAKAAFAQVGGNRKELAQLWTTYLDHPPQGA